MVSLLSGWLASCTTSPPPVRVLRTTRPVARGATLGEEDVETGTVPGELAPPEASPPALDHVVGRIVTADLAPHEVIRPARLAEPLEDDLASMIPSGMRVVDLAVPAVAQAGAYVDVWWTPPGHTLPCAVLQAVFVLPAPPDRQRLLLTPDLAVRVLPASRSGTLRVVVRNE